MTPLSWSPLRGLDPTPAEARDWLEQELHRSDYQSPWLESAIRWVLDQLRRLLDGAGHVAGLSPLITVLVALVVIALLAGVLPQLREEPITELQTGAPPNWSNVNLTPATVIEPRRKPGFGFGATSNVTVPLPVPGEPPVTVTQFWSAAAVH